MVVLFVLFVCFTILYNHVALPLNITQPLAISHCRLALSDLSQCLPNFRLSTCEGGNSYDSGYSGRDSTASNMTLNPDLQVAIPQVTVTAVAVAVNSTASNMTLNPDLQVAIPQVTVTTVVTVVGTALLAT
jgi:hypothetical protein